MGPMRLRMRHNGGGWHLAGTMRGFPLAGSWVGGERTAVTQVRRGMSAWGGEGQGSKAGEKKGKVQRQRGQCQRKKAALGGC